MSLITYLNPPIQRNHDSGEPSYIGSAMSSSDDIGNESDPSR